ncbi:unnamed protein product [Vicia faba]|uniref:Uncharacterized protein n=1 Tax=Vicia faba TaxID=3906 RepID=A0AAV1BBS4_VICFA|nr:unnamed protein product [Vicia faba]
MKIKHDTQTHTHCCMSCQLSGERQLVNLYLSLLYLFILITHNKLSKHDSNLFSFFFYIPTSSNQITIIDLLTKLLISFPLLTEEALFVPSLFYNKFCPFVTTISCLVAVFFLYYNYLSYVFFYLSTHFSL